MKQAMFSTKRVDLAITVGVAIALSACGGDARAAAKKA